MKPRANGRAAPLHDPDGETVNARTSMRCFMRSARLACLVLVLGLQTALAQQSPRFFDDISKMPMSPEVHRDRRVTIRLLAPKASEVLIVGGQMQAILKGPQ